MDNKMKTPLTIATIFHLAHENGWTDRGIEPATASDTSNLEAGASKDEKAEIRRLAALPAIQYDKERNKAAKALGVRAATLDQEVQALRRDTTPSTGLVFDDQEPWPDPVEPSQLLDDIAAVVLRFIVCSKETAYAVALWVTMTWFIDVIMVSALAVITAPEKRCGKSLLLSLIKRLVRRALTTSNISSASIFRTIEACQPTLLIDEADSFMKDNEEIRGVINSGHTRDSAYVIRTVGDDHEPRRFSTWSAKATAGIGKLPDTIMDRAIVMELRRKLPHEKVDRLRYAEAGLFEELAAKLCRLAEDYMEEIRLARPHLPAELNDRAQDNWEPLLAIADAAGGHWPERARRAALKLSGDLDSTMTIGEELLSDIQEIFEAKKLDRISTAGLILALCEDPEKRWATYNRGNQVTPKQIAKRLGEYGIKSSTHRIQGLSNAKGYKLEQFAETFSRYLTSPSPGVTQLQPTPAEDLGVTDRCFAISPDHQKVTGKPLPGKGCNVVTDKTGTDGE